MYTTMNNGIVESVMKKLSIFGIPMDLGAGRRGVDMGPSALRLAQLANSLETLGYDVTDHGNIAVPVAEAVDDAVSDENLHYKAAIALACQATYDKLSTLDDNTIPIILGGDHSISMGSVAGVSQRGRTGVIWVDAHSDVNTPDTSPSGNIHGMPLAHLLGYGNPELRNIWGGGAAVKAEDIVFIGLRSVDKGERQFIHDHNISAYTMADIDQHGIARVAAETLEQLEHLDYIHVSFDADSLDPMIAPGVGTPVPGGLSYREAHLLMELFAASEKVTSVDLVEVNPILDTKNATAEIMVEMCSSLLGKSIL